MKHLIALALTLVGGTPAAAEVHEPLAPGIGNDIGPRSGKPDGFLQGSLFVGASF